jgi:hypothetical protein
MTTYPKLPDIAVVDLNDNTLTLDGEKFPYYITQDGIDVDRLGDPNSLPTIGLTLFTHTVQVIPKRKKDEDKR